MLKQFANVILTGGRIVSRAFLKAIHKEIQDSQKAATVRTEGKKRGFLSSQIPITLDEAFKILDVKLLNPEVIETRYKALFKANDRRNGGSFYLQSKIVRAKERLDLELRFNELKKSDQPALK